MDNNKGKGSAAPKAPAGGGSNKGSTGGLKSAPANGGNGTMGKVTTKNPFPDGMC